MWTIPAILWLALQTSSLDSLPLSRTVALEGNTHHVQGIDVRGSRFWLTAVDRTARKGYLFEYDLSTGKRLREVEVQSGAMFHPGGLQLDADSLWLPVAEYRRESHSRIERRSLENLQVISAFEVDDHIGAVACGKGRLYGANWDARQIYEWNPEGKLLRRRDNPSPVHYQDMKFIDGSLIASGPGFIHWLDPESLSIRRQIKTGSTDRGVPFTNEGMALAPGSLYLLPEDAPSRLFEFRLSGATR